MTRPEEKAERLQKVLARAGVGSRREIERWIADGRIRVNRSVAELGCCIGPKDVVRVDGRRIEWEDSQVETSVLLYHKPIGEICSVNDPEGRKTVYDDLPKCRSGKWISIGRLDINSSGLLIFTNNGELANRLMHPRYEFEREYAVRVIGEVTEEKLRNMKEGVRLEDGMAHFDKITDAGGTGSNHWYHVIVREGRNREVRRLWESQNITVSRLMRVRFGNIALPKQLARKQNKELNAKELKNLLDTVGL